MQQFKLTDYRHRGESNVEIAHIILTRSLALIRQSDPDKALITLDRHTLLYFFTEEDRTFIYQCLATMRSMNPEDHSVKILDAFSSIRYTRSLHLDKTHRLLDFDLLEYIVFDVEPESHSVVLTIMTEYDDVPYAKQIVIPPKKGLRVNVSSRPFRMGNRPVFIECSQSRTISITGIVFSVGCAKYASADDLEAEGFRVSI